MMNWLSTTPPQKKHTLETKKLKKPHTSQTPKANKLKRCVSHCLQMP